MVFEIINIFLFVPEGPILDIRRPPFVFQWKAESTKQVHVYTGSIYVLYTTAIRQFVLLYVLGLNVKKYSNFELFQPPKPRCTQNFIKGLRQ